MNRTAARVIADNDTASFIMGSFLQFGVLAYLLSIGLESYLAVMLWKRQISFTAFVLYSWFVTARSVLMFVLLSGGNGGMYATAYWLVHAIDTPLMLWVILEQIDRPKWALLGLPLGVAFYFIHSLGMPIGLGLTAVAIIALNFDPANKHILLGVIVMLVFPAITKVGYQVPMLLMYVPTMAFLGAQAIWIQGLILKPKEEA